MLRNHEVREESEQQKKGRDFHGPRITVEDNRTAFFLAEAMRWSLWRAFASRYKQRSSWRKIATRFSIQCSDGGDPRPHSPERALECPGCCCTWRACRRTRTPRLFLRDPAKRTAAICVRRDLSHSHSLCKEALIQGCWCPYISSPVLRQWPGRGNPGINDFISAVVPGRASGLRLLWIARTLRSSGRHEAVHGGSELTRVANAAQ